MADDTIKRILESLQPAPRGFIKREPGKTSSFGLHEGRFPIDKKGPPPTVEDMPELWQRVLAEMEKHRMGPIAPPGGALRALGKELPSPPPVESKQPPTAPAEEYPGPQLPRPPDYQDLPPDEQLNKRILQAVLEAQRPVYPKGVKGPETFSPGSSIEDIVQARNVPGAPPAPEPEMKPTEEASPLEAAWQYYTGQPMPTGKLPETGQRGTRAAVERIKAEERGPLEPGGDKGDIPGGGRTEKFLQQMEAKTSPELRQEAQKKKPQDKPELTREKVRELISNKYRPIEEGKKAEPKEKGRTAGQFLKSFLRPETEDDYWRNIGLQENLGKLGRNLAQMETGTPMGEAGESQEREFLSPAERRVIEKQYGVTLPDRMLRERLPQFLSRPKVSQQVASIVGPAIGHDVTGMTEQDLSTVMKVADLSAKQQKAMVEATDEQRERVAKRLQSVNKDPIVTERSKSLHMVEQARRALEQVRQGNTDPLNIMSDILLQAIRENDRFAEAAVKRLENRPEIFGALVDIIDRRLWGEISDKRYEQFSKMLDAIEQVSRQDIEQRTLQLTGPDLTIYPEDKELTEAALQVRRQAQLVPWRHPQDPQGRIRFWPLHMAPDLEERGWVQAE